MFASEDVALPLMRDPRWEPDTLFLVFEEDFRFEEHEDDIGERTFAKANDLQEWGGQKNGLAEFQAHHVGWLLFQLSLDRWALGPSKLPSYECHGGLDELHEDGKSRNRLPTENWAPKLAAGSGGMVSVCSNRISNDARFGNVIKI